MSGRLNPWPAFADMMFMLALTTLVVAAGVITVTAKQRRELEERSRKANELKAQLEKLGINPENPQSCGLATGVVDHMQACLKGKGIDVQRHGCSLALDTAIEFETNSARLTERARQVAGRVAGCIIQGAEEVSRFDGLAGGAGLDDISIEGHADACGYHDWTNLQHNGIELPADRAKAVYDLVFEQITAPGSGYDDRARAKILGRIATRSFGPYRPLANVACDCAHPETCKPNRRVEIVVQGKTGAEKPNWVALGGISFRPAAAGEPRSEADEVLDSLPAPKPGSPASTAFFPAQEQP